MREKQRFLCILLLLSIIFEIFTLSVPAKAEQDAEVTAVAEMESLEEAVERQIRAFAKSIDQKDADDSAAMSLATHGITGSGKKLSLDKNHALTATLWNSELLQTAALETCVAAMEYMQRLDQDSLPYVKGFCSWNGSNHSYGTFVCVGEGTYESSNREYSLCHVPSYTGKQNAYDNSLDWMAGTTGIEASFQTKTVTNDTITYLVTYTIWDRFDFDTSQGSGFNQLISGLGALLYREFDWESTVTFELTVPYSCDHIANNYHWTYDATNRLLISDNANGYTENSVTRFTYEEYAGNNRPYYHKLDNPVRLYHDKPWVMEYMIRKLGNFVIAPLSKRTSMQPYLMNYATSGLLFQQKNVVNNQAFDCFGTYYNGLLSREITYTFRLENEIDAKGNNMVYLTIVNADNQTAVLNKVPMDDYYETVNGGMTLKSEESSYLNGVDLFISYIGNLDFSFHADYFDLKIWENGIDGGDGDYFTDKVNEPTCMAQGYTEHTCACCGYSYRDNYIPALGHDFGDWRQETAPTCAEAGKDSRQCSICGEKQIRPIASLEHDLQRQPDKAPSCLESGWHDYVACSHCDYVEMQQIDALGHAYEAVVTPPLCNAQGYTTYTCRNCGDNYVSDYQNPGGHVYGDWIVRKEATCTSRGERYRACIGCGREVKENISATGHSYTATVIAPTCNEPGYTNNVCHCGESYITNRVPAGGHTLVQHEAKTPTCTEIGWSAYETCANCDYSTYAEIAGTAHTYEAVVTPPTAGEQGFTTYTCTGCGDSYIGDYTDPLPYVPGDADGNGKVDTDDAIYLLYNVMFGDGDYPVNQNCDFDGNGKTDTDDAIYLLYHVRFGEEDYPLHN